MKKQITVTIGIPAYNEEENIKPLLQEVLKQSEKGFCIKEIIILSDASLDMTVDLARSFKDKRIKILDGSTRKGKPYRLNQLFKISKGDILVQLDADISLESKNTISHLLKPMIADPSVDLVFGVFKAMPPRSYTEKIIYFGFQVWDEARFSIKSKTLQYFCTGNIRAFSKKLRNKFRFPSVMGSEEDTYCFYYASENNYKIAHAEKAIVYIRLASNFRDYLKQMQRNLNHHSIMLNYFEKDKMKTYTQLNLLIMIKALARKSMHFPFYIVFGYLVLHLFPRVYAFVDKSRQPLWEMTTSTKKLK